MSGSARVAVTRNNAVLLLAAAEELGLNPGVVRTYESGFGAPDEVLEKAGFDVESGLPSGKESKKASEDVDDDPDTVGSGNPQQHDHDVTLTHEELEARDKAAAATSGEGAVDDDAPASDVATTPAEDQGEPPTTRPSTAKKATAKKATAKKATSKTTRS